MTEEDQPWDKCPYEVGLEYDRETEEWMPVNEDGYIVSKKGWELLCRAVEGFYHETSPARITQRNNYELRRKHLPPPPRDYPGYVYVITSGNGQYKIGRTSFPEKRQQQLEKQLDTSLQIICLLESNDMMALERGLHRRFAEQRVGNTEWFTLREEDIGEIAALGGTS